MTSLKENKAFCILPFIHTHVSEKNQIKLCCLAQDNASNKEYTKDFDFENDPDLQAIRAKIRAGERVPHCKICYDYEDGGADSTRLRDTREWARKLQVRTFDQLINVKPQLLYYDIRNDNLCNLSCRMCNPQFSSQLHKEYKKIGWRWDDEPRSFDFNTVVDMDTVQKIYVAGGEPSLMPSFRSFLERALEAGRTDLDIRISTNATNFNADYRELLSQFTNLNIICSIDGYDQVNRYIRWPADWTTLVDNVRQLHKITSKVAFNVTVSIWNIARLSELVRFFEQNFPKNHVLLNSVMWPPEQMPRSFPFKDVALADLQKLKSTQFYSQDTSFRSKVEYFILEMQSSEVNLEVLKKFFAYNDTLDTSRGVKLIDYIPELEQGRALIK
jgi:sulfatase maturation enzyme AslB (radical SAM superfamily)